MGPAAHRAKMSHVPATCGIEGGMAIAVASGGARVSGHDGGYNSVTSVCLLKNRKKKTSAPVI